MVADAPVQKDRDDEAVAWPVKWCRLVGGRWKLFRICPLAAELPAWFTEPKRATSMNVPDKDALTGLRVVFCKEFLPPSDWSLALKKPTDMLLKSLPEGVPARAYGWHVNTTSREEAVVGFFKVPTQDVAPLLQRSGWRNGFFQKLQDQGARQPDPIKWVPRGYLTPSAYLAEVRTQAKAAKAGIVLRRGGKTNLGLLGVTPETDEDSRRRKWCLLQGLW